MTQRTAVSLAVLATIVLVTCSAGHAQTFTLDLNDYAELQTALPWDTLHAPIDRIYIGPYHRVDNFLESDFARERILQEYSVVAPIRLTFRVPLIVPFQNDDVRDGAFLAMTPRPVDSPEVSVSVATIDDIAEERRVQSSRAAWKAYVVRSINAPASPTEAKKGLLNISVPVSLPGAVEKIIGQGEKTNIDISGRESITFAGETRRVSPYYGVEGQQKQSLFPSLDMKQELDVRLQGQIGEKINIQVDHTSSSALAGQNRIRLNYTGFDDDVIKLIELGNTSLSLPGSQLVSFSTSSKGLFGIKTLAQVGPLDITAIASKEEGEVSRASFSPRGGQIGQLEERTIADKDYVKNTYFFLDHPGYGGARFFRPQEGAIDIYRSVPDFQSATKQTTWGLAYVDSLGDGSGIGLGPNFQKRQFELLKPVDDYRFVLDANTEDVTGIELLRAVAPEEVLAVAYVNSRGDTVGDYGKPMSKDEDNPLYLEIIKPASPVPSDAFSYTWGFMIRNIYNLGLTNIDTSTLEAEILEIANRPNPSTPDSSAVPWIRIFGLDRTDDRGTGPPDNRIDLLTGVIDAQRGILTFPDQTPFDPDPASVEEWTSGEFAFTGRYEKLLNPALYTRLSSDPEFQSRFNIVVRAASTTRTFRIEAIDITEGSEVVKVDGQVLQRNRDYKIDYETGEVELLGDVPLTPSSNITIDYEYKPFMGGASSTLLGMNSIWNLSKNSRLGTTWLYESKASSMDRPRLGEEPTRAVVGGFDANLQYEPEFLTSLVNLLPLVDTDAASSFGLNGGLAVSFPDPNTKGESYVDDMEGVEDSDVFSLLRRSWYPASPPVDLNDPTLQATLPSEKTARILWYNIEPELGVHRRDLNPDLDERESTLVPSLDIEFYPMPEDTAAWAGVMAGFRGGLDFSQGQFLELWVNDFRPVEGDRKGVLHIDMGFIDEDFYDPDVFPPKFNNEDANSDGFTIGGPNEDTGLDGVLTGQPGDDVNPPDDYVSQRISADGGRFTQINGTEANGLLDGEDLDGSGQLDVSNGYITFTVDLGDSAVTDIRRDYPWFSDFTDSLDSWRLYRINLDDYREVSKDIRALIEQIKHVRIWVTNPGEVLNPRRNRIEIAEFKVVGNRWEKDGIRTLSDSLATGPEAQASTFALGVISNKTDPAKYYPPFLPNVQNEISEKEQSLLVAYTNIAPKTGFRVLKRFGGAGLDFSTTYQDLDFFVHTDKLDPQLEYFFRIGFDSLTFYEIALPLNEQYFGAGGWASAAINLNDLTSLKLQAADSVVTGTARDVVNPDITYTVRMVGRPSLPSLFNVRFLYAGLRNNGDLPASGELWIDDIYLGNRRRESDYAQRLTTSLTMGNVINLSGAWQRTGPDYVPFGQKRGSGTDTRSLSLTGKTNIEYFIPLLGFSVPVAGNFGRATSLPKYMPNSDTELQPGEIQDSLKTENTSRGFSLSLARTNSKNALLRYTFDKLKANFSMSQAMNKNPSQADTTLNMAGTLDYSISFGGKHRVRLFKNFGIRYWPNSFNYRINASRLSGTRYRNIGGRYVADPSIWNASLTNFGSINYVPLPSLTSSFRIQTENDLKLPNDYLGVDVGTEVNRSHAFQANFKPPPIWIVRAFSPDINYSSNYREDSSPNVRKPGDPAGVRNVSATRDISLKIGFDIGRYLGKGFEAIGLREKASKEGGDTKSGQPPKAPDTATSGEGERSRGKTEQPAPAQNADSTQAKAKPRVSALTTARKIADVFASIRRVNASVQQGVANSYSRIPGSPTLTYQFGLTSASGVESDTASYDTPERQAEDIRLTMDSGVQLTKNIDAAARFSRSVGSVDFKSAATQSKSMTWPDLSLSWKGLETFGPFRGLFTSASATMTWNKTKQESGRNGLTETTRMTNNITPSIVFQWKNDIRSTVGVQYQKDKTDTRGVVTENYNLNVNLDMKYTFTPGKAVSLPLPFLRNKMLKSRLDTSVTAGYSQTGGQRSAGAPGRFVSTPGTSAIRLSPRVAYNFTSALNGAFFIDFSRTYSDASDQTTTIVRLGLTATFTF